MALELKGKTALITGGGSGICLALTKKMLAAGANIAVVDRQVIPEAQEVIQGAGEIRAIYVKTDVTDWAQLRAAFERTLQAFGRLDIVVPGAGIFEPNYSTFWNWGTPEEGDKDAQNGFKIFDVNVNHPIRATQLAFDTFARQKLGHGVVCHIASIAAQLTLLPVPLYCASKHAIAAFVRSMAPLEQQVNLRVVAVAPGIVKTPLWSKEQLTLVKEEEDKWVTTDQVADVMIDLITNPKWVGGTILEVGADRVRPVEMLNDPGPTGTGTTVGNIGAGFAGAFQLLEANFGKVHALAQAAQ